MKLFALVATLSLAAPSFARDRYTGIAEARDLARSRAAARSDLYCGSRPRSSRAKREFRRQFVCPSTGKHRGACPGWTIDHVVALKRCGPDAPGNMAWQTRADARSKDRWE